MPVGPWELLILLLMCGIPLALLIAFAAVLFVRSRKASSGASPNSALEFLKKRYARGEIDDDEYEERRKRIINNSS